MSNSFNISVKPEIAALETKVDTIDTEVDAIRAEDVLNIRIDLNTNETKIEANKTVIDENKVILVDLHDTDLPSVATIVTAIQTNQFFGFLADDAELLAADSEQFNSGTSRVKLKEIFLTLPGIYRITFDLKTGAGGGTASGMVYKNGVLIGTTQTNTTTTYANKSEDLIFDAHDLVQLYVKADTIPHEAFVRNFKIKGIATALPGLVILD